jgi:prepilin-type N-terminal cleavage/methylation domain-containing protein/prepilin-type processing-associated H-X9-DG protein
MKKLSSSRQGFTLIELLVVIAIIALLAGLGHATYSSALDKAQTAAEVNAAKTLTTAYQAAAADQGGRLLAAYDYNQKEMKNKEYAFRLAPYFNNATEDTLLVSGNKKQIQEKLKMSPGMPMFDYIVSRFPSLGINRQFVGGIAGEADPECIRTTAQADRSLIVFASAGTSDVSGFGYVRAPSSGWQGATWKEDSDPGSFGYVDARHGGKAVVAFLDGSTRLMTIDELKDMRLWSMRAAQQNNPGYSPGK